jgi:hypothetical protein
MDSMELVPWNQFLGSSKFKKLGSGLIILNKFWLCLKNSIWCSVAQRGAVEFSRVQRSSVVCSVAR